MLQLYNKCTPGWESCSKACVCCSNNTNSQCRWTFGEYNNNSRTDLLTVFASKKWRQQEIICEHGSTCLPVAQHSRLLTMLLTAVLQRLEEIVKNHCALPFLSCWTRTTLTCTVRLLFQVGPASLFTRLFQFCFPSNLGHYAPKAATTCCAVPCWRIRICILLISRIRNGILGVIAKIVC